MDYLAGNDTRSSAFQLPAEVSSTDFDRKYPSDPLGDEMKPNARVWKVFYDESTKHDATMLDGWNKTLDILLIFSGLFSAVATAFLIESYKLLQFDNNAYVASALHSLVIATSNTTNLPDPPALGDSSSSPLSVWINGLWFTSLTLSLGVALLSILAKQWLSEYATRMAASASDLRDWAKRRMFFFQGLSSWKLPALVAVLPFILHVALFVFWAGLACFLRPLSLSLYIWITSLGCVFFSFWLFSLLAPLWYPDCPLATPVSYYLRGVVIGYLAIFFRQSTPTTTDSAVDPPAVTSIVNRFHRQISRGLTTAYLILRPYIMYIGHPQRLLRKIAAGLYGKMRVLITAIYASFDTWILRTKAHTRLAVNTPDDPSRRIWRQSQETELTANALHWLSLSVSNTDATSIAFQALGGVDPHSSLADKLRTDMALVNALEEAVRDHLVHPLEAMRFARSWICTTNCGFDVHMMCAIADVLNMQYYPDIALIWAWATYNNDYIIGHAIMWSEDPTPSLSSTTRAILRHPVEFQLVPALLVCVDFNEVDDMFWNSICSALSEQGRRFYHDHPGDLDSLDDLGRLCALELFAHGLLHSRWDDTRCAVLVLSRLLQSVMDSNVMRVTMVPWLVACIASDVFLRRIRCGAETLLHMMYLFKDIKWHTLAAPVAPDVVARALWNLVHVSLSVQGEIEKSLVARSTSFLLSSLISIHFFQFSEHASRILGTDKDLDTTLDFILLRRNVRTNSTLWEMLNISPNMHTLDVMRSLAIVLYYKRSSGTSDPSPLIDAFFAGLQMRDFLLLLPNTYYRRSYYFYDNLQHDPGISLLQHCLALRPSFWHDLSCIAKETGRSEHAAQAARGLLDAGPCNHCFFSYVGREWAADIRTELESSALDLPAIEDVRLLFGYDQLLAVWPDDYTNLGLPPPLVYS